MRKIVHRQKARHWNAPFLKSNSDEASLADHFEFYINLVNNSIHWKIKYHSALGVSK